MAEFSITQRHYDIILEQVKTNFPYESGGFIGGKDHIITAIFPVLNQDNTNQTNVFSIFPQDIERAHLFFDKHGLEYYGTYHSHPKGAAIPSKQDLTHIQRYLFIISLRNFNQPDFAAFKVTGHQRADRIPLYVISNNKFDVKNIHDKSSDEGKKKESRDDLNVSNPDLPNYNNASELNDQVNRIFEGEASYKKSSRLDDTGDFSTLA
jgi:proteasome lid subunit RPN8/RPN11